MTIPSESQDDSPSIAALAVQVSRLRRDVEQLTARIEALADTQHEHSAALEEVADLGGKVNRILAILSEEGPASPSAWFWLTMTEAQQQEKLSELSDWVETVLRVQYPGYLEDQLMSCWPNHPEARWELAWLYQLWTQAFLSKYPAPKDSADWHDRWFPSVIRRLSQVMHPTERSCQLAPLC